MVTTIKITCDGVFIQANSYLYNEPNNNNTNINNDNQSDDYNNGRLSSNELKNYILDAVENDKLNQKKIFKNKVEEDEQKDNCTEEAQDEYLKNNRHQRLVKEISVPTAQSFNNIGQWVYSYLSILFFNSFFIKNFKLDLHILKEKCLYY